MKHNTNFKRLLSGVLSAVITISAIPITLVNAVKSNSANFNYDGYAVSYNVTDSWDNTEIVSVTITNTSDSPIENWMLYFDPHGNITNIWDAHTAVTSTEVTYFKNAGYNSTIEPEASVTFSYFIDDCVSIPDSYALCQKRVEKASDGYSVEVVVDDSWDDVFNGTIIITNDTDMPIEDWELTFDTNFTITEITSSWASAMTTLEPCSYILKDSYTNIIAPHSSVNLGFSGIKNGAPTIVSSVLTEVVINEGLIDSINRYPDEASISAYGNYNIETNAVDIEWFTKYETDSFEVYQSDDNENYNLVAEVFGANSYQYTITDDFETKYFKVSIPNNPGIAIESIPFVVTKTDEGYSITLLDSDDDGLPDIYEVEFGTDINNSDTDDDGLTDYQEVYITGTDPTKFDSVTEGVSDADSDSDGDGLSNAQEIELGTDPQLSDTDYDNLSDYDELYVYGTDPIKPDTDDDGLDDDSELKFELDPNNPETYGIPDGEYQISQSIFPDNKILSSINTEDSPFSLSVEIKTNGDAEKEISISQSAYSNVIENDAMIGASLDFSISDTCNPEEIVLKYSIKDAYIDNTLNLYSSLEEFQGIKRLNIFKFHEDKNMLLPVETEFDVENALLYAKVDELGTYCIMDLEIWLNNLEVEPIHYVEETEAQQLLQLTLNNQVSILTKKSVQTYQFANHTYEIYDSLNLTWTEAKEYCESLGGHLLTITSSEEQDYIEKQVLVDGGKNVYWLGGYKESGSWKWITNEEYDYTNWFSNQPDNYAGIEDKMSIYRKGNPRHYANSANYWNDLNDSGNVMSEAFFGTKNIGFICEWEGKPIATETYDILLPTKWKKVTLNGKISPTNKIDTDGDTITDWEETDTARLIWNNDGSFEIPTFNMAELVNHLTRFQSPDYNFLFNELVNKSPRYYLPVLSDPTMKDSDGDGVEDWDEDISKRLKFNEFAFVFYDNEEFSEQGIDEGKFLKSKNSKLEVRTLPIDNKTEFTEYWELYSGINADISFVFHGSPFHLWIVDDNLMDDEVKTLKTANIKTLRILACNCGHKDVEDNIASLFKKHHNIDHLYAMDGNISYYPPVVGSLGWGKYKPRLSTFQNGFYKYASYVRVFAGPNVGYINTQRNPTGLYEIQ